MVEAAGRGATKSILAMALSVASIRAWYARLPPPMSDSLGLRTGALAVAAAAASLPFPPAAEAPGVGSELVAAFA